MAGAKDEKKSSTEHALAGDVRRIAGRKEVGGLINI